MQPKSTMSVPRWVLIGFGSLAALMILVSLMVALVAVRMMQAPPAGAQTPPAPASEATPEPTPLPEPTPEPTPEQAPSAKPIAEPVRSAGEPSRAFYGDVETKLMALNGAMLESMDKTTELRKNPFSAYDATWLRAWAKEGAEAHLAAGTVRSLPRYAGAEPLVDEAVASALAAQEYIMHSAAVLDAARANDTATLHTAQTTEKAAFDAYLAHMKTALALLP